MSTGMQTLSKLTVGEYLGSFGQNLKMFLSSLFRHQYDEDVIYRFRIWSIERNRGFESQIGNLYFGKAFDPSMGDGNSLSQASRSELFPTGKGCHQPLL